MSRLSKRVEMLEGATKCWNIHVAWVDPRLSKAEQEEVFRDFSIKKNIQEDDIVVITGVPRATPERQGQ